MIGARQASPNGKSHAGKSYVIFGRNLTTVTIIEGNPTTNKAHIKYTPLPEVLAGKRYCSSRIVLCGRRPCVPWCMKFAIVAAIDCIPHCLPADHQPLLLWHRHVTKVPSFSLAPTSIRPMAQSLKKPSEPWQRSSALMVCGYLPVEAIARSVSLFAGPSLSPLHHRPVSYSDRTVPVSTRERSNTARRPASLRARSDCSRVLKSKS